MLRIQSVDQLAGGLNLKWSDGAEQFFSFLWLRDHARDAANFDASTHQRLFFVGALRLDFQPDSVRLDEQLNAIHVGWPDSSGTIQYDASLLSSREPAANPMRQSNAWQTIEPQRYDVSSMLNEDYAVVLSTLVKDGIVLLSNCECSEQTVRAIAEKIGYVRETIYGGVWQFEANQEMADSAYSTDELRPHTDGTYSLDAPGLQLLLCLSQGSTGGESVFVDGFAVAEDLRLAHPDLYELLSNVEVTGIYKGEGRIVRASRPILRHDKFGNLQQISYNSYDRDVLCVDAEQEQQFYRAMIELEARFNNPDWQCSLKLEAGQMLVFDNWRLLHGRKAFVGHRKFAGCYVNREDFRSACLAVLSR